MQRQVNTIMSEMLKIFPRYEFEKLENRHLSNHYTKYFSGWQQLIVLLFAQAGHKDSLREIETSLRIHQPKWYHIGLEDNEPPRHKHRGILLVIFLYETPSFLILFLLKGNPEARLGEFFD